MVDFIRIPPDSTGKRLYTKQVTVDGTDVHAQRMQLVDDDSHVMSVDEHGAAYTRFTEGQPVFNAFSQQQVMQDYLIGVYEFTNSDYADLMVSETATGGTVEYQQNVYSYALTTTGFTGSSAKLTTNRYHYYQPGFSHLIKLCVSCGSSSQPGNVRRWGYYDDNNGVFFQLDSTGICVVKRSDMTGVVTDVKFYQDEWNQDKLDGTGESGVILDVEKAYIYFIDLAYPRGVSRFGIFGPDGDRITCFTFQCPGANVYANMGRPSLPVRVENYDTSNPGSPTLLRYMGAQVMYQGREPAYTFWRYGGMESGSKTVTDNTPLLTVQSKLLTPLGKRNTVNAFPENLCVFVDAGAIRIDVVSHSETSDLLTDDSFADFTDSSLQLDNSATAIDTTSSDYWIFTSFYCSTGVNNIDLRPFYELNDEGILLSGDGATRGRLTFVATKINGTTVNAHACLSVRELW